VKGACRFYIRNAGIIGALYCIVPALAYFAVMAGIVPAIRNVYFLRLGLTIVVGGAVGAYINRFGLSLWLVKHRSSEGPSGVLDGALVGGGIGSGIALLPALTGLIGTNHPEQALTFVVVTWVAATALGVVIGTVLAVVGRKHVDRSSAEGND
jgi:hypothetical protein